MSEIDPWALPQGGAAGGAGIPGVPYRAPVVLAQPLNRRLPYVVLGFGVLYVLVSVAEIFVIDNRVSLANRVIDGFGVTRAQADSADSSVTNLSWAALVVFIGALIAIGRWQRSLNVTLGSVGARKAVFARAGYVYFRATWVISILLSVFLNASSGNFAPDTPEQLVSHDHKFMLYYGLRALIGVLLIVFTYRLKKISEDAEARMIASLAR